MSFPGRTALNILTSLLTSIYDLLVTTSAVGSTEHLSNTNEQTLIEVTSGDVRNEEAILLDFNELTQTTTVRVYIEVDGSNYRLMDQADYPTDFPTNVEGIPIEFKPLYRDWKITLQSAVAEGAARTIQYARKGSYII